MFFPFFVLCSRPCSDDEKIYIYKIIRRPMTVIYFFKKDIKKQ